MTDWPGIATVIAPITTLLGGLGGYALAGRNDERRDIRAARREAQARREAFAERLEEARHTFQRDVLLELQDELQRYVRSNAQVNMQDRATIKEHGQIYVIGGSLAEEQRLITVSVQRLRARVLDDRLRAAIGEFMTMCTEAGLALARDYPGGKVADADKEAALARLDRQSMAIALEYNRLGEALGVHLRRELDRRYLLADSSGGAQ